MATPTHLASNLFQDLSGVDTSAFSNPYDALIHASNDDPVEVTSQLLKCPISDLEIPERTPETI
jgi:hypothetical protein